MNRKELFRLIITIVSGSVLLVSCDTVVAPTSLPPTAAPAATPTVYDYKTAPVVYTIPGMQKVKVHKDLAYDPTDPSKKMDVYYPADLQSGLRYPAVILVLCGGRPGDKEMGRQVSWGQLIAASGMVAVTFDWKWDFERPVTDIEHLIEYVRTNAETLSIDKDRLCVFAFSAGVPVGATAAISGTPDYVRCIATYYGSLNDALGLLGKERVGKVAPMLVVMAANDGAIPASAITTFVNEATSKGATVEFLVHPGGHSFDVVDDNEDSRAIIKKTLKFFQVHLGTHYRPVPQQW